VFFLCFVKKMTHWTGETVLCTIHVGKFLANATTEGMFLSKLRPWLIAFVVRPTERGKPRQNYAYFN